MTTGPRHATLQDIPEMVEMGRRFLAMAPHNPVGPYDGEAVARTLTFLVESPIALLVRNETGMLGGVMSPVFFSPGVLMMEESFWWATGGGQELRRFFESEARAMGARFSYFTVLENERVDSIGRVMKRDGYLPVERRHMKDLTQ